MMVETKSNPTTKIEHDKNNPMQEDHESEEMEDEEPKPEVVDMTIDSDEAEDIENDLDRGNFFSIFETSAVRPDSIVWQTRLGLPYF